MALKDDQLTARARLQLESLSGRAFSDDEWSHMRSRLIEAVQIVIEWNSQWTAQRDEHSADIHERERYPKAA